MPRNPLLLYLTTLCEWDGTENMGQRMGNGISLCFLASSRSGFGQAITKTLSIFQVNCYFLVIYISHSFRPAYGHLNELPGVPILVATATATKAVREDVIKKLDMQGCELVYTSPNRPNIITMKFSIVLTSKLILQHW